MCCIWMGLVYPGCRSTKVHPRASLILVGIGIRHLAGMRAGGAYIDWQHNCQSWHHAVFYNWAFCSFKKKNFNKIRFYSDFLQMSWDYRAEDPMSAHDGAECQNKTMVLFAETMFFTLKPKAQCIGRRKVGFFPTLIIVRLNQVARLGRHRR